MPMTALTMADASASEGIACTKDLLIFSASTGQSRSARAGHGRWHCRRLCWVRGSHAPCPRSQGSGLRHRLPGGRRGDRWGHSDRVAVLTKHKEGQAPQVREAARLRAALALDPCVRRLVRIAMTGADAQALVAIEKILKCNDSTAFGVERQAPAGFGSNLGPDPGQPARDARRQLERPGVGDLRQAAGGTARTVAGGGTQDPAGHGEAMNERPASGFLPPPPAG